MWFFLFLKKIQHIMSTQEILKGLNRSEKEYLYKQLRKELGGVPQLEKVRSDQNRELRILCPHCDCARAVIRPSMISQARPCRD